MIEITTTWAAIGAGALTSFHCVGMCGPLACSACIKNTGGSGEAAMALYHGGRTIAYTSIGLLCGALGAQPLAWFFDSPAVLLPWVLVALFLAVGFGWKVKMPTSLGHKIGWFKLRQKITGLGARKGALALGLATPFLPCGPLYLFFGVCLVSGSAWAGAEFAFGFAMGTIPLLLATQIGYGKLRHLISGQWMGRVQRITAISAALMIAFRLIGTVPSLVEPAAASTPAEGNLESTPAGAEDPAELPSCCH